MPGFNSFENFLHVCCFLALGQCASVRRWEKEEKNLKNISAERSFNNFLLTQFSVSKINNGQFIDLAKVCSDFWATLACPYF